MEHFRPTQYGFEWGPMVVERLMHDDRYGWCLVIKAAWTAVPGRAACVSSGKEIIVRASPMGARLSVEIPKGVKVYERKEA